MFRFYIYHPELARPQRLKYDPVGWDTLGKTIKRDLKWHGIFFEYTPKLKFIKDGKNLVHYFYEKYGIEAELLLLIDKYNRTTRKYERDYEGRFNLTDIELSDLYAECNIEQTGFLQKVKNRQDIKVDLKSLLTQSGKAITPNTNETVEVGMHSKELQKVFDGTSPIEDTGEFYATSFGDYHAIFSLDAEVDEIKERVPYSTHITDLAPVSSSKYLFKVKEAGVYDISIAVNVRLFAVFGLVDETLEFKFVYGKPGNYTTVVLGSNDTSDGFNIYLTTTPYNASLELQVDDELYVFGDFEINAIVDHYYTLYAHNLGVPSTISITSLTTVPATTVPLFLKHEALARIVESITDEPDSFRSEYYGRTDSEPTLYDEDGNGSLRGIVGGNLIRGFPLESNSTHVNLKDATETCLAVDGVGLGIETEGIKQRVRMEPLSYFYSPVRVAQFPYVKDIRKTVADDFIYNELEAGYDKWANEEFSNLDEFNTRREFTLPITQIKKRLILKAPWSASGYTIEFLRRDPYKEGTNKDNDRDNDIFLIQLRRESGDLVTDRDEDFAELNNLISPETVYNAKLSVMRNIKRNGPFIRSGLYHQDDKFIKLAFGEGNTAFNSRLTSETAVVDETTIAVEDLGQALWLPEIYQFRHKPTRPQLESINANPYGIIEFSKTNKNWKKGYLIDLAPDAKSGLTTFRLLRANV